MKRLTPAGPFFAPVEAPPAPAPDAAAAAAAATAAAAAAAATPPAAATTAVTTDPAQAAAEAAAAAATAAAAAQAVVPDKYTLTLPTGGTLDATDVETVAAMAKERKWTNEQAQAALDELHTQNSAQAARYLSTLQAHTEVGGAHLEASQLAANRALDHFLPANTPEGAELRSVMNKSGYGNYAPLVVLLSRIGKAMGEDKGLATSASSAAAAPQSAAQVLYGAPPIK